MDAEFAENIGSARTALPIDLNEAPMPSPRKAADDVVSGAAGVVSICTVCRKGVPVGRIPGRAEAEEEQQRRKFKCFRCLLRNDGDRSSRGGVGRFDINASPPREAEEGGGDVAVVGNGGGRIQASSSYGGTTRHVNPIPEDMRRYIPKTSYIATQSANPKFLNLDRRFRANQSTPFELPPKSPNMLYLQTLREYIVERSGILGEGWRVEFEFCNKSYKTSAIYIAPDGGRFQSMEDVACHLDLPSRFQYIETESGNNLPFSGSGSKINLAKDSSGFLIAHSFRKRQKLSSPFIIGGSVKEHSFSEKASHQDGIHCGFPIQFQDFCLISAGKVDPRPSYHTINQIWPVGYRSSWHDRITGSLFVCDIADGGVCGPIFKIHRYPCTKQSIPAGSTILSKTKPASSKSDDYLDALEAVEDDSLSTITLLNEDSPPCLENCLSNSKREDEGNNHVEDDSPNSDVEIRPQRRDSLVGDDVGLNDIIGEFQVEGRSTSYVWELVSQAFLYAFCEAYKRKGTVEFFCVHDFCGLDNKNLYIGESLSRFCYFDSLISIPPLVRNEKELNMACQMLLTWLNQDRFGLDADFVQEILEQLSGATSCSEYKILNDRKQNESLQTVGSGFLHAEMKHNITSVTSRKAQFNLYSTVGSLKRDMCPPGEPLNSRLPSYLMGDALQVWELAWRFLEVLELGQPFSLRELETELVSPWLDGYHLNSRPKTEKTAPSGDKKFSQAGLLYTKIVGSLLKLLVSELLSKAAVYVCPNSDVGESKSRRGRKKDLEGLAALKRTELNMLPVNGLTWHEIARRYILAVLCMDGNLDSMEIASCESRKVFHCLRGDGGILCGALKGIAALEGDAVILADAMKVIFGSMRSRNEIITVCERESDDNGAAQTVEVNDGIIPEWAQVLEPVRKLPTNVGARIRRCINEALEKNPPEWAKKVLEHSISKEVYKGNASGPTKRAVISVLANLGKENPELKDEKNEKVKTKTNLFDLITKQCRIVLRRAAALDEDRVFCNLLARTILNPNDNGDEGILGYLAMVSRPLDFRTVDLRLAAGAYGGSHEVFVDDVREVWHNIRTAYGDRSDLIDAAEILSKKFEDLYEQEVLTLVHKITEISTVKDSSADSIKERDELLVRVCNSSLPRAPWEEGICKVCGMDKDDDNVLLCDKCDSEYHRYCLNPPLLKIPEGNWYCPSCVAAQSIITCSAAYGLVANKSRRRKHQGEFTSKLLEELARLAKLMEIKEYWEFTVEERTFFMKFLFDDSLNSATIRDHMDQSASRSTDLQQKLRSLTSELKLLKFKEDMLGSSVLDKSKSGAFNAREDLKPKVSPSLLSIENSSSGKHPEKGGPSLSEKVDCYNNQSNRPPPLTTHKSISSDDTLGQHENIFVQGDSFLSPIKITVDLHLPKDNSTLRNDISNLQGSIASLESELLKVSLRKDYLGRDSNSRVYWAFSCPGARPWIIACGDNASNERRIDEFVGILDSNKWMCYESDNEIEKLIGWLRDDNVREKELKESISQLQSNNPRDAQYSMNHILSKTELNDNGREALSTSCFSDTNAKTALENIVGPHGSMRRCECLELVWPSKDHCPSCHQSFSTSDELRQHHRENCKAVGLLSKKSQTAEVINISKLKKPKNATLEDKRFNQISMSEKQNIASAFSERYYADCPFDLEEIMTRFVVPGSVKDVVNEIGLISNNNIPSFLPTESPYLSDPALTLGPTRINKVSLNEMPLDLRNNEPRVVVNTKDNKEPSKLPRCAENILFGEERTANVERSKCGPVKVKTTMIHLSKNSIICDSALRPLMGRASEILRSLKIILLDMDAALPEDALRMSRSNPDKSRVWRAFVKSANSIYEMVQATIVLEDAIKSEYLRNEWWYWSSPSTAAKITTLSALALRIYSLDAAISYEKPLPSAIMEPSCALDEEEVPQSTNSENPSSPPIQKTSEPESTENPRTRSRSSKRRKI